MARITGELADLDEIYRRDGVLAALKRLGEIVAADFTDREPDASLPEPPDAQRLANLEFFFSRDVTAMVEAPFHPADATALKESPVRVVTAAGRASRRIWNYDCAQALAALLGTEIVEFPGGHTLSTHPKAFAARLHEVLTDRGWALPRTAADATLGKNSRSRPFRRDLPPSTGSFAERSGGFAVSPYRPRRAAPPRRRPPGEPGPRRARHGPAGRRGRRPAPRPPRRPCPHRRARRAAATTRGG